DEPVHELKEEQTLSNLTYLETSNCISVCAPEGSSVSLGYSYHQEPTTRDYFFWYQQYPGKSPEFLVLHSRNGISIMGNVKGLNAEVKSQNVSLLLSSAAVGDSAVYYCAVRPTVTGNTQTLNKNL
uniref:Immunoglobulin V-set domain-containing protein n=1 Tax=Periophthalmus magnuspinnatus TaxID=409849 RepID=A0A3B3ZZH7_9GOBI